MCHLAQLLAHLLSHQGLVLLLLLHQLLLLLRKSRNNLVQKLRRTNSPQERGGLLRRCWGAPRSPRGESLLRKAGLVGAHLDVVSLLRWDTHAVKGVRH